MKSVTVLKPTSEVIKRETSLAHRLPTLEGKVLGIVNNSKRNSDVFMNHLVSRVKETYALKDVIWINKRNASMPITSNILEQLKLTDAAITGVGD